jgi:hypothetical protein
MTLKRSATILISAGAGLVLLAAGTTAGAAIAGGPVDGSGVIHGCWTNAAVNGTHVFVLQDAGTNCPKGTTAISWNQKGSAGPAGPAGAAGPAGPAGPAGATGPEGTKGDTGGPGPAGADGSTVLNGSGAPTGNSLGRDGDFYIDTQADVFYGPKAGGAWPLTGTSLAGPAGPAGSTGPAGATGPAGPQGPAGTGGSTVLNGTGAPGGSLGNDGDFYIDTAADVLYGPKTGGIWPAPGVSLVGSPGAAGPAGPAGTTGQQSTTVYGTGAVTVTPSQGFVLVPGVTQTVTVTANSLVLVSTGGGAKTLGTADTSWSNVVIEVFVDGSASPLLQGLDPMNTTGATGRYQFWSLTGTVPLSPGTHTIAVEAEGAGVAPDDAQVGGGFGSLFRPNLTVTILNS